MQRGIQSLAAQKSVQAAITVTLNASPSVFVEHRATRLKTVLI
jgi:hypothetical protein